MFWFLEVPFRNDLAVVIDIDLSNYFDLIDRLILKDFVETKIKDIKFVRYIVRMFKAGVLDKGEIRVSKE